jgi:3-deoxy-D-manno-octulosonate 8-phosphate phosphatase (KDO 8-P phosphatase)
MQARIQYPPELLLKAQGISVAFFDVDGVLTDGGLYISERGETLKRFHTLDGHGFKLLQAAGIVPVVISGRKSKPLQLRLRDLGVEHAHFGVADKVATAQGTLDALGLTWNDAAAIGDDWPDLALMQRCAFTVAPPQAHEEVLVHADFVTHRMGGHGAAREFCDLLLIARGSYGDLLLQALA